MTHQLTLDTSDLEVLERALEHYRQNLEEHAARIQGEPDYEDYGRANNIHAQIKILAGTLHVVIPDPNEVPF